MSLPGACNIGLLTILISVKVLLIKPQVTLPVLWFL